MRCPKEEHRDLSPQLVCRFAPLSQGSHWVTAIPTLGLALGDLVRPDAHPLAAVVGQTGRALVLVRLSGPAGPERVAAGVVSEDAVQARTVRRRNGRLCR